MSSPFSAPLRLAVDGPGWLICLLVAIAVTATAIVAGHRHAAPEPSAEGDAPATVDTAAAVDATVSTHREPAVSRSGTDRRDRRTLARPGLRTHRAMRVVPSRSITRKPPQPQLPLASSDAAETVASAMSSTANVPGHCLEWSREQAGIPSKYMDATTAWEHASGRRPADANPPRGAAVYWTGGSSGYGHIAISLGNGKVRSSDAGGYGQVATVRIHQISEQWDLHYAGWANTINGYRIPGVAAA